MVTVLLPTGRKKDKGIEDPSSIIHSKDSETRTVFLSSLIFVIIGTLSMRSACKVNAKDGFLSTTTPAGTVVEHTRASTCRYSFEYGFDLQDT